MTRSAWIAPNLTYVGGQAPRRPVELTGLADLLRRCSAAGYTTLLLDPAVLKPLGLPVACPKTVKARRNNPALRAAQAAGWSGTTELIETGWTTFHGDGVPAVGVGLVPWLASSGGFPLVDADDPQNSVEACDMFDRVTGHRPYGIPGVVGNRWLTGHVRASIGPRGEGDDQAARNYRRKMLPTWKPTECGNEAEWAGSELPYTPNTSELTGTDHARLFGWDGVRAGLGALRTAYVARHTLRPNHKAAPVPWNSTTAGMWCVDLAEWTVPGLPHPAGPRTGRYRQWVSWSTMALLTELTDAGVYGGFTIRASYTAPVCRDLQEWAAELDKQIKDAEAAYAIDGKNVPALGVADMVRCVYSETVNMWVKPTSTIRRPDWRAEVNASARTKIWRKAWNIGRPGGSAPGTWPVRWDGDCLFYEPVNDERPPVPLATYGKDVVTPKLGLFHLTERVAS